MNAAKYEHPTSWESQHRLYLIDKMVDFQLVEKYFNSEIENDADKLTFRWTESFTKFYRRYTSSLYGNMVVLHALKNETEIMIYGLLLYFSVSKGSESNKTWDSHENILSNTCRPTTIQKFVCELPEFYRSYLVTMANMLIEQLTGEVRFIMSKFDINNEGIPVEEDEDEDTPEDLDSFGRD